MLSLLVAGGGVQQVAHGAQNAATGPSHVVHFSWGTFKLAPRISSKLKSGGTLNYVLSIEGTGIPIFGAAMKAGFDRGIAKDSRRHPIHGSVIGPISTDVPTQVSQINSLLGANQIDCLTFEAHAPGPYVGVINKAMSQGVPVFGVNADSPQSHRIGFYALNEQAAGAVAGKITGLLIKQKHLKVSKAALLTGAPEGPYAQHREIGFMQGLRQEVPGVSFVNSVQTALGTTYAQATVYSTSRSFITGHSNVQLLFHTDQGVELVGKAIKDLHLTGKVWTSGFNLSPAIIDEINGGQILTSIGQGWNKQEEAGVHACTQFILNGTVPQSINYLQPVPVTKNPIQYAPGKFTFKASSMARSVTTGGA
jgi:ribose transport system substrate-binding protein